MKFRVISDLHVEFYDDPEILQRKLNKMYPEIEPNEVLIVAGDLGVAGSGKKGSSLNKEYKSMLEYFAKRWNFVILVPGNHEYYDRSKTASLEDIDNMIRTECQKLGIHFLNKNSIVIDVPGTKITPVIVMGCTLWSRATPEAYKGMNDKLQAILRYEELIDVHESHVRWLKKELKSCKDENAKIVVITHHLPMLELNHKKYQKMPYLPLNSGYATDLSKMILKQQTEHMIAMWVCGHTHERKEISIYGIKFVINPIGYPGESKETEVRTKLITV